MNMVPFYTDGAELIARLLHDNWSLDMNDVPNFYYRADTNFRSQRPGSIFCYNVRTDYTKQGIDYGSVREVKRVSIDVQNPTNEERHYRWVNEVLRIIQRYRRGGPCMLEGGVYLDWSGVTDRLGYTNYYHSVLDVAIIREVKPLAESGFENPCKPCGDDVQ